jgi:hypothetical protein
MLDVTETKDPKDTPGHEKPLLPGDSGKTAG